MTPEQGAALLMARSACLIATVLGMQAENMQREACGHSMAYDDEAFQKAIDDSGAHHNAAVELLNGCQS